MRNHDQLVTAQFGTTAEAYLTSTDHAQGADLQDLAAVAQEFRNAKILDVGCGAGHASFAVAPHAQQVIAYDLAEQMLAVVQKTAQQRALANLEIRAGSADALPFDSESFDLVCTRYSAHHWKKLPQALSEIARVLKVGGKFVMIDTASPTDTLADTYLQAIELLRDTSHVRNFSLPAWETLTEQIGLQLTAQKSWKLPLQFDAWVARMRTPPQHVTAIRSLWNSAPQEVLRYFQVAADGSFVIDAILLEATKAGTSA